MCAVLLWLTTVCVLDAPKIFNSVQFYGFKTNRRSSIGLLDGYIFGFSIVWRFPQTIFGRNIFWILRCHDGRTAGSVWIFSVVEEGVYNGNCFWAYLSFHFIFTVTRILCGYTARVFAQPVNWKSCKTWRFHGRIQLYGIGAVVKMWFSPKLYTIHSMFSMANGVGTA